MLAPLLLEHRGELRADFQQFYTLDSEELLNSGDYERLATLAYNLPAESRIVKSADQRAIWDNKTYLLALIVDHLAFMRYENAGGKGKKPKPLERPKQKKKIKHKKLNISEKKRQELLFGKRKAVKNG